MSGLIDRLMQLIRGIEENYGREITISLGIAIATTGLAVLLFILGLATGILGQVEEPAAAPVASETGDAVTQDAAASDAGDTGDAAAAADTSGDGASGDAAAEDAAANDAGDTGDAGDAAAVDESVLAEVPVELISFQGEYFSTAGICATCHANTLDADGNPVPSITETWRSSLMANSGRDPYWRASVRAEITRHPEAADFIQDKCSVCHVPMARTTQVFNTGEYITALDDGYLNPENELHLLALDSVSCTVCHQIEAEGLMDGTYASNAEVDFEDQHSGHYVIDSETPQGERVLYGPYDVAEAQSTVMHASAQFFPAEGDHIQQASLCASCHTLFTPFFDVETGEIAGDAFPEQTPYDEWVNSDYNAQQETCQDCHMTEYPGQVVLSVTGGPLRENFNQHLFVGANVYMLRILETFADELEASADSEHFQATQMMTRENLLNNTATLMLENAALAEDVLTVDVVIDSLTGHKLPTSYPSRRAWLHLTVTDAEGSVIFESGEYEDTGFIPDNASDQDAMTYEPHYDVITSDDQVQIYEPIMLDTAGNPTTTLLLAGQYVKDNRILPHGFDKDSVPDFVAVYGEAAVDDDFVGGGDRVTYEIPVAGSGPYTVSVEMVYQSIGYRWANNLAQYLDGDTPVPEIVRWLEIYETVPNIPELIGTAETTVE